MLSLVWIANLCISVFVLLRHLSSATGSRSKRHRVEIAALAAYLCRDEAKGITAENIQITGGALW